MWTLWKCVSFKELHVDRDKLTHLQFPCPEEPWTRLTSNARANVRRILRVGERTELWRFKLHINTRPLYAETAELPLFLV